jgi:hypothetical protein
MRGRLLGTIPNEVGRQERPGRRGMSNLYVFIPVQNCEIGENERGITGIGGNDVKANCRTIGDNELGDLLSPPSMSLESALSSDLRVWVLLSDLMNR